LNENKFVPTDVSKEYILKDLYKKKANLESELQSATETTGKKEIEQEIGEIENAIKEVEGYKDPLWRRFIAMAR